MPSPFGAARWAEPIDFSLGRVVAWGRAWGMGLATALALAGCSRNEPASERPWPENVIARVGEAPITEEAVQAEWKRQGRGGRPAALERLIRRELVLAEVERTGFGESPEMQQAWRHFVISRYLDAQRPRLEELPPPSASELDEYYQTHRDTYAQPERRQVALIYLRGTGSDPEQNAQLAAKAAALRGQAMAEAASVADFGSLAARYSDHRPSRGQGGNVGWIVSPGSTGAWPAAVMVGIQSLSQPGEISPVIVAGPGCYLLKLIAWEPSEPVPLEQVRERVAAELVRERSRQAETEFYAQLRSRFPVRIQVERLEEITPPTQQITAARPPRLPRP